MMKDGGLGLTAEQLRKKDMAAEPLPRRSGSIQVLSGSMIEQCEQKIEMALLKKRNLNAPGPSRLPVTGLQEDETLTLIMDELSLDVNVKSNVASFVNTHLTPQVEKLVLQGARINMIDEEQYPHANDIQQRCVDMIGDLWNASYNTTGHCTGTSTIGSSEAIMLATLAMKWRWKKRRQSLGLSVDKPNIVFASTAHTCWKKACLYFEIDAREANVSEQAMYLTPECMRPLVDENTIGVCPILGSTYNGTFGDIEALHHELEVLNAKNPKWQVPMHVDAASGGFIAPFTSPKITWDFRLPLVQSINASGHKFGLANAGLGWLLFKNEQALPDELVTRVEYLGGNVTSFTMNFSKPASSVLVQYYNFMHLGRHGYTEILETCNANACFLRDSLLSIGKFAILDDGDMPTVAVKLLENSESSYTLFDLRNALRKRGWGIPAYHCSKGAQDLVMMRIVVKQNFSRDMAELLFADIKEAMNQLDTDTPTPRHVSDNPFAINYDLNLAPTYIVTNKCRTQILTRPVSS